MTSLFSIKVKGVSKRFASTVALDQVVFHFDAAKIHGLIGPEGAGKTTLMRIILGLLKPNSGEIGYFQDKKDVPFSFVKNKMAYMPQQPSLYADLSIEEHLQFFKQIYQLSRQEYQSKRDELYNITKLGAFADRPAGKLSGGMYKKLGLMCALLRSPEIILLDEPTNGVDPISRRELWELLYRLTGSKILILLSTAYMDEAERCSVVHLLDSGKPISEGDPKSLLKQNNVKSFDALFLSKSQNEHDE